MLTDQERSKIYGWISDDNAYSFFMQVSEAYEFWDDLLDKDKPISDSRINSVMFTLMVILPSNPFFIAHRGNLLPFLTGIINSWAHLVPKLEANELVSKKTVYAVRRCITNNIDFLLYIIFLVHGMSYVSQISNEIADFAIAKEELFAEYVDGLTAQRS